MLKATLQEFVEKVGQTEAAEHLGLTQPALRKALFSGRAIFVEGHKDGTFTASEIKRFPSPTAQRAKA